MLLKGFVIYVGEVHIVELHAAQLFELFFDTATHFQCQLEDFLQLVFCIFTIRVQQLDKTADHLAHSNGISLV